MAYWWNVAAFKSGPAVSSTLQINKTNSQLITEI